MYNYVSSTRTNTSFTCPTFLSPCLTGDSQIVSVFQYFSFLILTHNPMFFTNPCEKGHFEG